MCQSQDVVNIRNIGCQSRVDVCEHFAKYKHILLEKLVSESLASKFLMETRTAPSRRVICGAGEVNWQEHRISSASLMYRFFCSEPIINILNVCLDKHIAIEHIQCWASVYGLGEYINRHKDGCGDIQLILSLKAATAENGGWLNLEWRGETRHVFLETGDALCFLATEVEHFTDPLVPTNDLPTPERVTAVARYFLGS